MFGRVTLAKVEKLTAKKKTGALIGLIGSKKEDVRLAAVRGLGSCESDDAFNALVPLVHASDAALRKTAVLALSDMNRPEGRVHIEHQLRVEKDPQLISAMHTALGRMQTKN